MFQGWKEYVPLAPGLGNLGEKALQGEELPRPGIEHAKACGLRSLLGPGEEHSRLEERGQCDG